MPSYVTVNNGAEEKSLTIENLCLKCIKDKPCKQVNFSQRICKQVNFSQRICKQVNFSQRICKYYIILLLPQWLCCNLEKLRLNIGTNFVRQNVIVPNHASVIVSLLPLFSRTHGSWQPRILRRWPLRKGLYSSFICLCVCLWESFKEVQHWIVNGTNIVCSKRSQNKWGNLI